MLMKFSMNAPAQFHAGSIQPEYPISGSESIANPYTQPVHVFSDPLLLTRTCPSIKIKQTLVHRPSRKPAASAARENPSAAGAKESSPALGERSAASEAVTLGKLGKKGEPRPGRTMHH